MKKVVLTFLILNSLLVFANEVDYTPQWSQVAPYEYSGDLKYIENNTFAHKHRILNALTAGTIVGYPIAYTSLNRSAEINNNNYWYSRKLEFEQQVNICNQMKSLDNKMACYNNVVQAEHSKTAQMQQLQMQQTANAINVYNGMRLQNSINNLNKPATYMRTGNFIYKY